MLAWGMERNINIAAKEDNNNLGWPLMVFIQTPSFLTILRIYYGSHNELETYVSSSAAVFFLYHPSGRLSLLFNEECLVVNTEWGENTENSDW